MKKFDLLPIVPHRNPSIYTYVNFYPQLWPHSTPMEHDFNKLESTLLHKGSCMKLLYSFYFEVSCLFSKVACSFAKFLYFIAKFMHLFAKVLC